MVARRSGQRRLHARRPLITHRRTRPPGRVKSVTRWHPSSGFVTDAHTAPIGRPVVHLATRTVIGWTMARSDLPDLAHLDAILAATVQDERNEDARRPPLVVLPWCPVLARALLGPSAAAERMRDVVVHLPSASDPHEFDVALARIEGEHLRAAVTFEGDVASIVAVHERGLLDVVRVPGVRGPLDGGPAALETRLGMRLLEALAEADVTVLVDGVATPQVADRLRRAGIRFAQGPLFDSGDPETPRSEAWRPPIVADVPFEGERLDMIDRTRVLDSPPEAAFDTVVQLAAERCRTPMAAVSIVAHDRQWFKASRGLGISETPRGHAFCATAITNGDPLIVRDALGDPRFATNPLVLGSPFIRSYLGVPLRAGNGLAFGALCVMDDTPRRFSTSEVREVAALAQLVTDSLELRAR